MMILKADDCRYFVAWLKEPRPNEIKFVIKVKDAETTSLGFAEEKKFVRK